MNRYRSGIVPLILLTAAVFLFSTPALAATVEDNSADTWAADYEQLTHWEFSTRAMALPASGIRLRRDTAEWIFETGTVRPMRPTTNGSVTGLVFEGQGVFRIHVPDPVEVGQLSRFNVPNMGDAGDTADTPEFSFGRMILRTTDQRVIDLFHSAAGGEYEKSPLAEQRHLWWLEHARFDADARVEAGLLNQGDEYLAIDMETDEHGWLFYEFDGWRMEEVRLCRMRKDFDFVEVWVSLDRDDHRRFDGSPGSTRTPLVDLLHADLEVDLMEHKGRTGRNISRNSYARGDWIKKYPLTRFRSRMEFQSLVEGLQAVPLRLNPWARGVTVTDAEGRTLPVLRAPLGKRFPLISPEEEDTALVVILRTPLARGETAVLDFSWEQRTSNYPGGHDPHPVYSYRAYSLYLAGGGQDWYPPFSYNNGRYWYPEPLEGRDDRHTARVTIVHPKKLDVRATGTPTGDRREEKKVYSTWESKTPIKMAGFSYGRGYDERRVLRDGLPEVICFGVNEFLQIGDRVESAAAHMTDSIQFYQEVLDYPLPMKTVTGTRADGATQSFSGFITFDRTTFDLLRSWSSEWAMAKRTAELFWGGLLDWESYRDMWLADALAGYSAMMYLEALTENWDVEQMGPIPDYDRYFQVRQHQLAYATYHHNEMIGPLNLGFRDIVPEVIVFGPRYSSSPVAYLKRNFLYNSKKGLAVLHMLRGILSNRSETGAQQFNAILADFLKTHAGGTASTRDFIAAVERVTDEDWDWFFDQWVYSSGVPIYTWAHSRAVEPDASDLYLLEIQMQQDGVSPDFRMPVTFWLEFEDADPQILSAEMDQQSKTFTVLLPTKPVEVIFDPYQELLYVAK